MRFVADQIIAGLGPSAYEALYFDETFNEALCQALAMRRRLDQRDVDERGIVRRVAIAPRRQVPRMLRPLLGGRTIEYTEAVTYQWGHFRGSWRLEPALMADRVHGEGSFHFAADPAGTRRVVEGELRIQVAGVGGLAERLVVDEVERSYKRAATFTSAYVAEHPVWQRDTP